MVSIRLEDPRSGCICLFCNLNWFLEGLVGKVGAHSFCLTVGENEH